MSDENKTIGRSGYPGIPEEANSASLEEATIPDYAMLDCADDFFPDEAANSRLRKPHAPPELLS